MNDLTLKCNQCKKFPKNPHAVITSLGAVYRERHNAEDRCGKLAPTRQGPPSVLCCALFQDGGLKLQN